MKIGDIILIPFPYAEMNNIKLRPAVVITETADTYKDIVVSAISSIVPNKLTERELIIKPNKFNKLRVVSVIKVDRIVTLKKNDKIADLGRLDEQELMEFKKILMKMIK